MELDRYEMDSDKLTVISLIFFAAFSDEEWNVAGILVEIKFDNWQRKFCLNDEQWLSDWITGRSDRIASGNGFDFNE